MYVPGASTAHMHWDGTYVYAAVRACTSLSSYIASYRTLLHSSITCPSGYMKLKGGQSKLSWRWLPNACGVECGNVLEKCPSLLICIQNMHALHAHTAWCKYP